MTTRKYGRGQVSYAGWHPSPQTALVLVASLADASAVARLREPLPEGMVFVRRGPYRLLFNFAEGSQAAEVDGERVTVPSRDLKVW
jgi:hypothetical protein